jgi:hypothetical protein
MNQKKKQGFRSPSEFVEAANEAPALMHVDPAGGVTVVKAGDSATAPAPELTPAPTPAPAQAAGEGAPAAQEAAQATNEGKPAQAPAPAKDKPQRPAKPAADKPGIHTHRRADDGPPEPPPAPWDSESPDIKGPGYQYRFDKRLHAQIQWISDNVPQHKSMQVVIDKAVRAYVAEVLEKHYKPE